MNSKDLPVVLFVLVQAKAQANGGIASIGEVIVRMKRHRPVIVTDRDTPLVETWRKRGIEVHVVPQSASAGLLKSPLAVISSYARYAKAVRGLAVRTDAAVIHANDPAAFQLSLAAAKSTGRKIVLNLRDTLDPARRPPRMKYRLLFAVADHVLYLSNDMADRWEQVAANARRSSSVTYSVVDPTVFKPSPIANPAGAPAVLLSGIIRPKKGQLEFLRNVAPVLAGRGVATWLAGDFDPDRNAYMRACSEAAEPLGGMVEFLGYRSDVPKLMERSSVIAIASRHEGLVRAMIEGLSCGRPVVSFDVCSAREILEDRARGSGIVVNSGDFAGMADAVADFALDRKKAAEAGKRGSAAAEKLFAPDEVVARYEQVYDMLAGRPA